MTPLDPVVVRALALGVPVVVVLVLWVWKKPPPRAVTGLLLATAWQVPPLLFLNALAPHLGWWSFDVQGGVLLGVPVDLLIAWAFLWGAVPSLIVPLRVHPMVVAMVALLLDAIFIPLCRPVIDLSDRWLLGECLLITVALLPGLLLDRWTRQRRNLMGRAVLQAACFAGMVLGVIPAILLDQVDANLDAFLVQPGWVIFVQLQLLFVPAAIGLIAVQEFVVRGRGSALPADPPLRLVYSGPYAFIANPMQLATVVLLMLEGALLRSPQVMGAGLMVVVFGVGFARWHEEQVLKIRFGSLFSTWRGSVRAWFPRWRPWVPFEATLYFAEGCTPCEQVARWVGSRSPVGLKLVPAQDHPHRDLSRITYDPGDGGREEQGVEAFCRALEHLHFGWAVLAWCVRLPGVRALAQWLVDVCGGGPRTVVRRSQG